MKYLIVENLAILICAAVGFLFGAFRYLRPRKPLYASMIVLATGCVLIGRLFQCILLWTGGSLTERFQIGALGAAGAFAFFLSANYGQIDSLVDDGGKRFRPYRAVSWTGPLLILALYVPVALSPAARSFKLACALSAAIVAVAGYFHVKHLFIPDVDYGVVRCQRPYNALALSMGAASVAEMAALARSSECLLLISGAVLCACSLAIVPTMDRGVKKWTA